MRKVFPSYIYTTRSSFHIAIAHALNWIRERGFEPPPPTLFRESEGWGRLCVAGSPTANSQRPTDLNPRHVKLASKFKAENTLSVYYAPDGVAP